MYSASAGASVFKDILWGTFKEVFYGHYSEAARGKSRWYLQSKEDLKWAKALFDQKGGYHIICFLCQQIGGKCLKAYLYATGEEIVLGHSIVKLAEKASSFYPVNNTIES